MYSASHVGARGMSVLIDAGRTPERVCGTLDRSPGHGPGGLQDDSHANFSVGDSCHVVGSEQGAFAVWDGLAGNEVRRFPAQDGGPREGSGPIGAPDSCDDVTIRGGPSHRAANPIKVGEVPPSLSCLLLFEFLRLSLASPRRHRHDPPPAPHLRLLISTHTTSTPPAYFSVLTLWTPPLLDSSSSFTVPNSWF